MGEERHPPAWEEPPPSPLPPASHTPGTWSHRCSQVMAESTRKEEAGGGGSPCHSPPTLPLLLPQFSSPQHPSPSNISPSPHTPPCLPHSAPTLPVALPFPIPFWGGHCAQSPPRKERRTGTSESWERRPGLGMLTSARFWAKQAQDWFVEGHCPAQLIPYPQRGLGHFCHDHWEERLTLGLVRDTRHSLAVVRRELRESLGGGEPGRSRGSRTPGEFAGRTGDHSPSACCSQARS